LALARVTLPEGGYYADLCFHAQQAAEKALKAVYVSRNLALRYVHDLEELITGLRQAGLSTPEEVQESAVLTSYAFEARYPGGGDPVTPEEHARAVEIAERVARWAEARAEEAAR